MIQIDIDMPKQCGECPLCVDYDCIIHKRVTDEYYDTLEEQYAHCPLTLPSAQEKPFNLPEIYIADGYDTVEGEDGNVGFGVYVPDEKQIYIAGDVDNEVRLKALFHELCHWVQDMCGRPFDEDEANRLAEAVYDAVPSAQPEPCEDAINRADIVWHDYLVSVGNGQYREKKCAYKDEVDEMPSVTQKRKTGEWIDTGSGQECSECGEIQYGYDNCRNFCANCGARMER